MHELGYCVALRDTLLDLMKEEGFTVLTEATLTSGKKLGIVPRFMIECWNEAAKGTELEGMKLHMVEDGDGENFDVTEIKGY